MLNQAMSVMNSYSHMLRGRVRCVLKCDAVMGLAQSVVQQRATATAKTVLNWQVLKQGHLSKVHRHVGTWDKKIGVRLVSCHEAKG